MSGADWKALVADKRRRQRESIPKDWIIQPPPVDRRNAIDFPREAGLLSPLEFEITETSVETLLSQLASGTWSAVNVTTAFYKRAVLAHQVVNCLTEIFVEKALSRASELDDYFKRSGKVVGPLHGLPISLKDQLSIKGLETVMGYASWIGKYADHDCVLVELLYELGAVPFVRTNVPQTLMWGETFNHVFGRTLNPYNLSLTSGGSSGGEGALIALHGSPLGVGSDIGGSVRIPSNFNGIYGLRPSCHRIPYSGAANSLVGQTGITSVLGPLSNSVYGLKIFTKAILNAKPWRKDPLAHRMPWDEAAYQLSEHGGDERGLVFAIMWDDGIIIPHPPVRRALELTKESLQKQGYKVLDWKPYNHGEICQVTNGIFRAAGEQDFAKSTAPSGEPIIKTMAEVQDDPSSTGEYLWSNPTPPTAFDLFQLHKRKEEQQKEYLDHWQATAAITGTGRPVDAIIAPAAPYAAPPHGQNRLISYTMVFNLLDYPVAVFPVTQVDQALDVIEPRNEFLSDFDKLNYMSYDPAKFKDSPVGLQLVGQTQDDEAVIRMCEVVDECLKRSKSVTTMLRSANA